MYTLESYVDAFQQTKKRITDKVIINPTLNKAAHNYINAQTVFAKMVIANTQEVLKHSVDRQSAFWFPEKAQK